MEIKSKKSNSIQKLKIQLISVFLIIIFGISCIKIYKAWFTLTGGDEKYWLQTQNVGGYYYMIRFKSNFTYQRIPFVVLKKHSTESPSTFLKTTNAIPSKIVVQNEAYEKHAGFKLLPFFYNEGFGYLRMSIINEDHFEVHGRSNKNWPLISSFYAITPPDTVIEINNIVGEDRNIQELSL